MNQPFSFLLVTSLLLSISLNKQQVGITDGGSIGLDPDSGVHRKETAADFDEAVGLAQAVVEVVHYRCQVARLGRRLLWSFLVEETSGFLSI